MEFDLDFGIFQSHKLLFTPRLKQALNILEMNSQELFSYIDEQIEENPVLELTNNRYSRIAKYFQYSEKKSLSLQNEKLSLKEYLHFQLHVSDMDKEELTIGEYLIENVDETGYIHINIFDTADLFNTSIKKIFVVLKKLQKFDPPGICARNLMECLINQLENKNEAEDAVIIIKNSLYDLAVVNYNSICNKTGLSKDRVRNAVRLIKSLEPKPGRGFCGSSEMNNNIPDVIIAIKGETIKVYLNSYSTPVVEIDRYYIKLADENISNKTGIFIQNRINSALWLKKFIDIRKKALLKISEVIVDKNRSFFEGKSERIKRVALNEAAHLTNMNEYMLRKAMNNKYLKCHKGCLEFSFFFKQNLLSSS